LLSPHKRSFETVSPPADKALYNTSSYLQTMEIFHSIKFCLDLLNYAKKKL